MTKGIQCVAALLTFAALAMPARGQTSLYAQVNVAGDFNGWETLQPNMQLVAHNTWQADIVIAQTSFEFKFATPGFAQDWGFSGNQATPMTGYGVPFGPNIHILNNSENKTVRFRFYEPTAEFSVFLINNVDTNLLQNPGFEEAGTTSARAKYWQLGNPNDRGNATGAAERQNWGTAYSGNWMAMMLGTWANQGENGAWWQDVPVEAGMTYEASAFFSAEGPPNPWTADNQELRLEFYNLLGTEPLVTYTRDLSSVTTQWVRQAVSGVAPAGSAWARITVDVTGAGSSGTLRIDEADLRATTARRQEDFNTWFGATIDDCYTFSGWSMCDGQSVSNVVLGGVTNELARSGLAASIANPTASTAGVGYVQSPRLQSGVGTISFYYRHGHIFSSTNDLGPEVPVTLSVQVSFSGDFWTEVARIENIFNTQFQRFDLFQNISAPRYVRIQHVGGSTNRVLIEDVSIAEPAAQPRFMDFNSWDATGTNAGCHVYLGWQVCSGFVASANAKVGKAAQVFGSSSHTNFLLTPVFSNGYSAISFSYRRGQNGGRQVGFRVETSADGDSWTVLDTVTNISTISWLDYSVVAKQSTPHSVRIVNLPETNVAENAAAFLIEHFDGGSTPPAGWEFNKIGQYDSTQSSGASPPSLQFNDWGSYVITPLLVGPTNATFMTKGNSMSSASAFTVEGMISGDWALLVTYSNMTDAKLTRELPLTTDITQLRFTYYKAGGNLAFDDLIVEGESIEGEQPPQILMLEDVHIAEPVEYRSQNFDTWPTKPSFAGGVTEHENWVLNGAVSVTADKAYAGQAARLSRTGGYLVNFEGDGETKGAYGSGTVNLSGLDWNMTEALIGTLDNDWKDGERSARMRGFGASSMTMIADKSGGLGNLSFDYRRYGTDVQVDWMVQVSTNGGSTWTQVGANFTAPANDTVQTFSHDVNVGGNVRVRIKRATETGTQNRRLNIDNILMADFGGGGDDDDGANPSIQSDYYPAGIGTISFRYRHWLDVPAAGNQILTARVQISSNGVDWTTMDSLTIDSPDYSLYELFLFETNHYLARILVNAGTESAAFDTIQVAAPGPPANVTLVGWHMPDLPFTNDAVTLHARVTPRFGAHTIAVTSYYRIGTSGAYSAMAMIPQGGNLFQAPSNIAPQEVGTIVQYYMEASFRGGGSELNSPVYYPTNYLTDPAWYGIPRNPPGRVWINEIDYRASGEFDWTNFVLTVHEFIELAGYAGTDITDWRIELRSGNTTAFELFGLYPITNNTVIANATNGFGFFVLGGPGIDSPPRDMLMTNTLSDSDNLPGAVRLLNEMGGIEHALSYGGSVPAHVAIPTLDPDQTLSNSVVLVGTGLERDHFAWGEDTPMPSPGAINEGQSFGEPAVIVASASTMTFYYSPGGVTPPSQTLIVSNAGVAELTYALTTNVSWLSVTPVVGTNLNQGDYVEHAVSVNITGQSGSKGGQISIDGTAPNSPVLVTVLLSEISVGNHWIHYPFDEGSGSSALNQGLFGSEAHLALAGNAGWTLEGQGASAKLGDFAYRSSTNTAHAATTQTVASLNSRTAYTITGWIRPSETGANHRIVGNYASNHGFDVMIVSNNQNLSFVSSSGSAADPIVSTNGLFPTNTWTFFAVTYDSTDMSSGAVKFYRGTTSDVAAVFTTAAKGDLTDTGTSTNRLFIGGTGAGDAFKGWIDDIRIYPEALDSVTVDAIRLAGATRQTGSGTAPNITTQPTNEEVAQGGNASFLVVASGDPLPQYQWRKDGTNIASATSAQLFINGSQYADIGYYDVIVFNVNGSVTSQPAFLSVWVPPVILTQPTNLYVYVGMDPVFTVSAIGFPHPNYQWSRSGTNIIGATTSSYTIANAQVGDSGSYRVSVTNAYGSALSQIATLTVRDPDDFGYSLTNSLSRVVSGSTTGIVIRWESANGVLYDVYWTTNIKAASPFVPIATNLPPTPPVNAYTDTVHGVNRYGIYQIRMQPAP